MRFISYVNECCSKKLGQQQQNQQQEQQNQDQEYIINVDGHECIDLGLPSGTKWATMNVGAETETDYGNYYICRAGSNVYQPETMPNNQDTATVVYGESWATPTYIQIQELIQNTTYEFVIDYNSSGKNGALFTAENGATLFIPAAGFAHESEEKYNELTDTYYCDVEYTGLGLDVYIRGEGFLNEDDDNMTGLHNGQLEQVYEFRGYPVRPVLNIQS